MAEQTLMSEGGFAGRLTRLGFWCSVVSGLILGVVLLGNLYLYATQPAHALWLLILLNGGPVLGLLLANIGTMLNYYGIWRILRGKDAYSARDDALGQLAGVPGNLQGLPMALGCGSLFSVGILALALAISLATAAPPPLHLLGVVVPSTPPTPVVQVTPTPTSTATPTPTPIPTATPPPTATATPVPVGFSVDAARASGPGNFNGICAPSMSFSFTGTIFVPAGTTGGTVTYGWQRSDGSAGAPQTVTFSAGETAKTVGDTWTLTAAQGTGATYADKIQVSAPNVWFSTPGTFAYTCQLRVQSISASANPTFFDACAASGSITFTATLTLSPSGGGSVTYYWVRDGGGLATRTVMIAPGATATTVTDVWSWVYPDGPSTGDHYEQLVAMAPNSVASNQAHSTGGGCN
jgi:hypothetical protein